MMLLTASLVLYKNSPEMFDRAIQSFLTGVCDAMLLVVDNSPAPLQSEYFSHPRVQYFFNGKNAGFGAGHNRAIREINGKSRFHLLLNPDVQFTAEVTPALLVLMQSDQRIGAVMPRIVYPDGSLQHLCKLLPTPVDLVLRRFIPFPAVRQLINRRYELHSLPLDQVLEVPSISGCFLMLRTDILVKIGGFDERYFMYMEDVDLVRRIGDTHRVVFDPLISVIHDYGKGSYLNNKLLRYHMKSALKYFSKWGWCFDRERRLRNSNVLCKLASRH